MGHETAGAVWTSLEPAAGTPTTAWRVPAARRLVRAVVLAVVAGAGCSNGMPDASDAGGAPARTDADHASSGGDGSWRPTAPRLHHTHLNTVDADAAIAWYRTVWPSGRRGELAGHPAFLTDVPVLFTEVDSPPPGAWDDRLRRAAPQSAFWHIGAFVNTTDRFEDLLTRGVDVLRLYVGPDGDARVLRSGQTPYEGTRTAAELDSLGGAAGVSEARPGGFGYLVGPDGALVEMTGGPSTTASFSHVHLFHEQPACAAEWYVEHLGMTLPPARESAPSAEAADRAATGCATVDRAEPGWPSLEAVGTIRSPRATIVFDGGSIGFYARQCDRARCGTDAALVPSRGQVLDHVAFEVADLDGFADHLRGAGIPTEGPYAFGETRALMVVGPDGLSIELVEGSGPEGRPGGR